MNHLYYAKLQLLKLLPELLQLTFFFPFFLVLIKLFSLKQQTCNLKIWTSQLHSQSNIQPKFSCVLQSASGLVYNATFGAERINDK